MPTMPTMHQLKRIVLVLAALIALAVLTTTACAGGVSASAWKVVRRETTVTTPPPPPTTTTKPLTFDDVRGTPYTVSYDSRAILIDGQRVLMHSGSIHYPRSTPAMWASLLNLTKAAGLNTVEIYVFWDIHESQPGVYDFETFNRNLPLFLQLVGDAGLFAFLRIGPYVCAEWNWGAMPLWIHQQGIVVRSMDPRWLTYMESFVRKVVEVTEPYLARNGGPVFLAQIENEYGNVEGSYPDGPQYVQWCANLTVALNASIPWVMCQQSDAPQTVINSCNGFYCDSWIATHASRSQPAIWTEAYPGWFQAWGEAKPARPVQDMAFAVARWIARGGALHNYYMWHGGTSFGRHVGGPMMITSYDYNAPLDEYGVPNPTMYPHLAALHLTTNQYASVIINNAIPTPATPCGACEVHIYGTASTNGIAFLSNTDDSNANNMSVGSTAFEVPAWTVFFVDLATLQVVYRTDAPPSSVATEATTTTTTTANGVRGAPDRNGTVIATPADLAFFAEPVGLYDPSTAISAYGPQDQINVAAPTSDYLWYVTYVQLTATQISNGKVHLSLANCGDLQYVFFNGVHMGDSQEVDISVAGLQVGVQYALQVLSVTLGIQNYGSYLDQATRGLVGTVTLDGVDLKQQEWYHQVGLQGESLQLYTPNGAMSNVWQTTDAAVPTNTDRVWYRFALTATSVAPPSGDAPYATFMVDTLALGKGMIWVNGFNLGRYWDVQAPATCPTCVWQGNYGSGNCRFDCGEQSQRFLHVPAEVLVPPGQSNVVVMFAERGGDPNTVVLRQRD